MTKIPSLQAIVAALLACGLAAGPAQAGPNRTFVSGTGTDSGACSRTAPCRTFAFAFTQTAAGGEIDVLDPAGYGALTITHAISIGNDGAGTAGITAGPGNAITINAGASDSVHLRGLTIEGISDATNGILFKTGGNLAIENCVILGFGTGITISPSTSSSFSVSITVASNNGSILFGTGTGIMVQPTGSAVVKGVLGKVTANNNGAFGIVVDGGLTTGAPLNVTIADSEASNNTGGVRVTSMLTQAATAVMARNVVASGNGLGISAEANSILRVAHSVVTGNHDGLEVFNGGIINSYGDNDIDGNGEDNTALLTVIPTH